MSVEQRLVELPQSSLSELKDLLNDSGLPCADLEEPGRRFYRWEGEQGVIGWAGLEPYGADALLRSMVILERFRNQGAGAALVEAMMAEAQRLGIRHLWLLTTTASGFFEKRGFHPAARDQVPPAIGATQEYRSLCPASAICMVFDLKGPTQ